jgi:N-acetylneuraminic acid mutarotase
MIIWGGTIDSEGSIFFNTGGRYNPLSNSWARTTTSGAPSSRTSHTAVWTGTQMVVWGGCTDSCLTNLNTGGRYNPSTNSWLATTTTGAPSARSAHTAVWTGSRMIIWGGCTQGQGCLPPFNTGGRYNPSSDSWAATTIVGAPAGRFAHTAVWTGTEMIVWGGYNGADVNTGGRYNPSTNSWVATATTGAPSARSGHTAVWTGTRMIIWGGFNGTAVVKTGRRYNPSTNSWLATKP